MILFDSGFRLKLTCLVKGAAGIPDRLSLCRSIILLKDGFFLDI